METDKNLRIVIVGDLHLRDRSPYDLPSELRRDRIMKNLGAALHKALVLKADYIVLLGDVFDGPEPSSLIRAMLDSWIRAALDADIKVRILNGNHDSTKDSYALMPEQVIWDDVVVSEPVIECIGPIDLLFVPYMKEYHWEVPRDPHNTILFGHFGVKGAKMDNGFENTKEGLDPVRLKDIHHCYLGHYHTPQSAENYTYLGVVARTKFSEMGFTPRFLTYDIVYDDSSIISLVARETTLKDINFHEYHIIQKDLEDQERVLQKPETDGIFRYRLEGTRTWISKISSWLKGFEGETKKIIIKPIATDRKISQSTSNEVGFGWNEAIQKLTSDQGQPGYEKVGEDIVREAQSGAH